MSAPRHTGSAVRPSRHDAQQEEEEAMSEYLKDSGHRTMRTCDGCGGAFFCGDVEDWDEGEDDSAPDWTCETCAEKDATIKALADALWDHGDVYGDDGWHRYGCPLADVAGGNCGERCKIDRAALRLAGRL
jgi:hypothetical protein